MEIRQWILDFSLTLISSCNLAFWKTVACLVVPYSCDVMLMSGTHEQVTAINDQALPRTTITTPSRMHGSSEPNAYRQAVAICVRLGDGIEVEDEQVKSKCLLKHKKKTHSVRRARSRIY